MVIKIANHIFTPIQQKKRAFRLVFSKGGQALTGLITVLEDKEYMVTLREKMNNIKKVAKFYNYEFLPSKR